MIKGQRILFTLVYYWRLVKLAALHLGGASQVALVAKNPPANAGDKRLRLHLWIWKIPWRRAGNPFQYSCLENPMDRRAWQAAVHRVTKSWIWLKRLSTLRDTNFIHLFSSFLLNLSSWTWNIDSFIIGRRRYRTHGQCLKSWSPVTKRWHTSVTLTHLLLARMPLHGYI